MSTIDQAGVYKLAGHTVRRLGYGAMQLAGPSVFGPPKDRAAAIAVLREAVAEGVNHIDTSDFYGPHVTNQIIREALAPYPADLVIVTKVSALEAPLSVLAELQRQGLIRHIGLSNVTPTQVAEGRKICEIVCVQNHYNLAHRADDALIDGLARDGVPYVPFFPLGGFTPLQSSTLAAVARRLGATSMQVALAWLLKRAPNLLLIPGTASLAHLRDNLAAARLALPDEAMRELDEAGRGG